MARVEHFIALIHTGDSAEKIIKGKGRPMPITDDFLIAYLNQKLPIFPTRQNGGLHSAHGFGETLWNFRYSPLKSGVSV